MTRLAVKTRLVFSGILARRILLLTVLLGVALAACGGSSEGDVAPFGEIAVAGPYIEIDPSGTAAVLTVETLIDTI